MISSEFNVSAKKHQGIPEFYGDDIALLKLDQKVKMSTHARCLSLGHETALWGRVLWGALEEGTPKMGL